MLKLLEDLLGTADPTTARSTPELSVPQPSQLLKREPESEGLKLILVVAC